MCLFGGFFSAFHRSTFFLLQIDDVKAAKRVNCAGLEPRAVGHERKHTDWPMHTDTAEMLDMRSQQWTHGNKSMREDRDERSVILQSLTEP